MININVHITQYYVILSWYFSSSFPAFGRGLACWECVYKVRVQKEYIFKASALWADAFYKSKCPYICGSVCVFVHF